MRSISSSSASLMPAWSLIHRWQVVQAHDAAAGVVEKDAEVLRDVEKRHRLAVMIVGHGAEFELDGFALGHER